MIALGTPGFADNPIDILANRINSDESGLWVNGIFPRLDLPPHASSKQVIDKAVQEAIFDEGRIKTYNIIEIRTVNLKRKPNCSAALMKTNLGQKILLFNYEGSMWWSRFYDAPKKQAEPVN